MFKLNRLTVKHANKHSSPGNQISIHVRYIKRQQIKKHKGEKRVDLLYKFIVK